MTIASNIEFLKSSIIQILEDKKAQNIIALDLAHKSSLANYMIVASADSKRALSTIANYISLELKHQSQFPISIEGINISNWVTLDIGDIIIHLFHPETRQYYQLEELWG